MKLTYASLACPDWSIEEAVSAAERYGYAAIEWRLADGVLIGPVEYWEYIKLAIRLQDVR